MPVTEIRKTARQVDWEGEIKQSVLNMMRLRCLLDISVEMSAR